MPRAPNVAASRPGGVSFHHLECRLSLGRGKGMVSRLFVTSLPEKLQNLKFTAFGCKAPLRFKTDVSRLTWMGM